MSDHDPYQPPEAALGVDGGTGRFDKTLRALESNGSVRFGPFSLTPIDIVKGRESLPRSEADGAEVQQGWLQIYRRGAERSWASARFGKVENGDVLISILEAERR